MDTPPLEFFLLFLAFYLWHGMGVTIGYHRYLAHKTFRCPKAVEYFWVLGGYLGFQGSPIWWAAMHRAHHRWVDTPLDPHSPRYGGLWHAYFGWIMAPYPEHIKAEVLCSDLVNDPVYKVMEKHRASQLTLKLALLYRVVLFFLFGWQVALASLLAGLAVLQIPLVLNLACHLPKLGYRRYATEDDSVNVWWVGLMALGEGWHNNHHAFPGSAQTGMHFYEFDMSWLTLKVMRAFGLVRDVKAVNAAQAQARLASRQVHGAEEEQEVTAVPISESTPIIEELVLPRT